MLGMLVLGVGAMSALLVATIAGRASAKKKSLMVVSCRPAKERSQDDLMREYQILLAAQSERNRRYAESPAGHAWAAQFELSHWEAVRAYDAREAQRREAEVREVTRATELAHTAARDHDPIGYFYKWLRS